MKTITKEHVDKIKYYLSFGLTKGLGEPKEGEMCIEAVICNVFEEGHTDRPSCVGSEVNKCKIALNDCEWSSNEARAKGMSKLAIAQLGSINIDQDEFRNKLFLNSCKSILVFLIRKHYDKRKDENLLEWIKKFENCSSKNVDDLWKTFYYNYYNYYNNKYYNYYNNYYYYDYYYYYYDYYYSFKDEFLLIVAETILQTLKDLDCEGCKWL